MAACAGCYYGCCFNSTYLQKVDLTMVLNGALAGLVSCTAGPDLGMNIAFIEGLVGGALVVFAVSILIS